MLCPKKFSISKEGFYVKLKNYHDGYHFFTDTERGYNPFGLLKAPKRKEFGKYRKEYFHH